VPVEYLIGEENLGFMLIMSNFNHERFVICVGACRSARLCYEIAFKHAMSRETFGKPLIQHQLIRFKLAEMARQIEALHDNNERLAYQVCYLLVTGVLCLFMDSQLLGAQPLSCAAPARVIHNCLPVNGLTAAHPIHLFLFPVWLLLHTSVCSRRARSQVGRWAQA
jgi:alkylation response protein AidB-like acyl-CoA dehydrogenase